MDSRLCPPRGHLVVLAPRWRSVCRKLGMLVRYPPEFSVHDRFEAKWRRKVAETGRLRRRALQLAFGWKPPDIRPGSRPCPVASPSLDQPQDRGLGNHVSSGGDSFWSRFPGSGRHPVQEDGRGDYRGIWAPQGPV